jgi:RND superfamily putative drug exporter
MIRLAMLGIRRPRAMLAVWGILFATLGFIGLGIEGELHRSDLSLAGSGSDAAQILETREFGEGFTLSVLLTGPAAEVASQGRALADRLADNDDVVVLSPWTKGADSALRPSPGQALLLIRVSRPFEEVSTTIAGRLRDQVDQLVSGPVTANLTGFPALANAIHGGTIEALQQAEVIAAPLLAIVLMFVFRSMVAASVPLLMGFATIGGGTGVLTIINRFIDLDASALNLMTAMGLALGVDYSLLIVSRFREELDQGTDPTEAAAVAARTAGATVIFAGTALGAAVTAALVVAPGGVLASAASGALVAAAMSIITALTALPAALTLIGRRIERGSLGRGRSGRWSTAFALGVGRRPIVAVVVGIGLLALCIPALGLTSGAPDPRNLSADSRERKDFETFRNTLGAGWAAPFNVVIAADDGSMADQDDLDALEHWQSQIKKIDGVSAVFGVTRIADQARKLRRVPGQLEDAGREVDRGERAAKRLKDGTRRVQKGVARLRAGTARGANGADRLVAGIARASHGVGRLTDGTGRLVRGIKKGQRASDTLIDKSRRLVSGTRRLRSGLARAGAGTHNALPRAARLTEGLEQGKRGLADLREPARTADQSLDEALSALKQMLPTSKADPRYKDAYRAVATAEAAVSGTNPVNGQAVKPGYKGLVASLQQGGRKLDQGAQGAAKVQRGLGRLDHGLGRLQKGATRLDHGAKRARDRFPELEHGFDRLRHGADRLDDGGSRLDRGTGRLRSGATRLEHGLDRGADRSSPLQRGSARLADGATKFSDQLAGAAPASDAQIDRIGDIFRSGAGVTAAVQQAPASQRKAASLVGNFEEGGSAAKLVVIADSDPTRPELDKVRPALASQAAEFERETGDTVEIGGAAATLQDFGSITSSRLPPLIIALVVVTYLVLIPIFRSLLLPLIAVALNVVTVAAAFGVLVLLFEGTPPLLGGTGQLDSISIFLIFTMIFGLAIDYEVFLIMRMREGWLKTGETNAAVDLGLRKTGAIVTGAALIMTGVFVAFSTADIATVRQLGVGLTIAVVIDATLVRLVLLPAVIRLFGRANWWLPSWMDRALPQIDLE